MEYHAFVPVSHKEEPTVAGLFALTPSEAGYHVSRQSHDHFKGGLAAEGHLFFESDMVEPDPALGERAFGIDATDLAFKQFKRKVVANMIMMGFVNGALGLVSHEALVATVKDKVPPGTEKLNIEALGMGMDRARAVRTA